MCTAFDHNWQKLLNGTYNKKTSNHLDMVEQVRKDIRDLKTVNNCQRIIVFYAASTEIYITLSD